MNRGMQSALASALNVSLENDQEHEGDLGAEELNLITDETTTVLDETLQEVAASAEELDMADATVEELELAADSMESMLGALSKVRGDGALDAQAMTMYNAGLESLIKAHRLPLPVSDLSVSNEAFAAGDAMVLSLEAEEKGKNLLQRMWDGIKNAIVSFFTKLKTFITNLGKSGEAVANAGRKLQAAAKGLGTAEQKEGAKVSGGWAKQLVLGGSVDAQKALVAVQQGASEYVFDHTKSVTTAIGPLTAALSNATAAGIIAAAQKVNLTAAAPKNIELPGGAKVEFKVAEGDSNLAKLAGAKYSLTRGEAKAPESIKVLSIGEINALGSELIKMGGQMTKITSLNADMDKANSQLIAAGEKLIKAEEGADIAAAKKVLSQLSKVSRLAAGIIPTYMSYAGTVGKAAFAYGKASLAQYKGSKADATANVPATA